MECPECDEAAFAPFDETNAKIRRLEEENEALKKKNTELKPLIEEMIEITLSAVKRVECPDYNYAIRNHARRLIVSLNKKIEELGGKR